MKNPILVLGAGRSAGALLEYLNQLAGKENFRFTLADTDPAILAKRKEKLAFADIFLIDNPEAEFPFPVEGHQITISLLPPPIHPKVGKACLKYGSHLLTASYESPQMREMKEEIEAKGLLFLNECGLDPGIDHMSAMELIEEIREKGGKITGFQSFCGGLVADEDDDNPFRYKISWNPRNVVLAGKGTSRYLENGLQVLMPYHRLFSETEEINIPGWGSFEGYANRDSVPYKEVYGLHEVENLKRGTLRKKGFSPRWNALVQLGMTDDESQIQFPEKANYFDFLKTFIPHFKNVEDPFFEKHLPDFQMRQDILNLGFRPENPLDLRRQNGTPADFLLDLIVQQWALKPGDKDMVVMVHKFNYTIKDIDYETLAYFGLKGIDENQTAMAKTVGLPLAILAKMLLHNEIKEKGLSLPLKKSIFGPVLKELSLFGIEFQTQTRILQQTRNQLNSSEFS
jgi:saccharopine dehydrogenase-like NADP-dependent oxidoreductase